MPQSQEGHLLRIAGSIALTLAMTVSGVLPAQEQPRIVVLLVVDQMRADFFERFAPLFDGGLARVLREGVVFSDTHHDHAFTRTAAGHATLSTGAHPARTGIPDNAFWDQTEHRLRNAVEDGTVQILGAPSDTGRSPAALRVDAVGDWLNQAHPESRVFAVAGKHRAAIFLGGRHPDGAYWYHGDNGAFVTSTYYRAALPDWVEAFNAADYPRAYFRDGWTKLKDNGAYDRAREDSFPAENRGVNFVFPHGLDRPGDPLSPYEQFALTPHLDDVTFQFAESLVVREDLGGDDVVDLLLLGISSGDNIGHEYGPMSQEVEDFVLRLDRRLGSFLAFLDERIGPDRYALVLTSDHGAPVMPEENQRRKVTSGRVTMAELQPVLLPVLQKALFDFEIQVIPRITFYFPFGMTIAFPDGVTTDEQMRQIRKRVAEAVRKADWAADAFTYDELADPDTRDRPYLAEFRRSFVPDRAPDVIIHYKENFFFSTGLPVDHGTPYGYDTHVPLIFKVPGLAPRVSGVRAGAVDVAPTIAHILGITVPGSIDGKVLSLEP